MLLPLGVAELCQLQSVLVRYRVLEATLRSPKLQTITKKDATSVPLDLLALPCTKGQEVLNVLGLFVPPF